MRISDWSSDVCSSDLSERRGRQRRVRRRGREGHDEGLLRLAKKSDGRFPRERFEQEREDDEHLEREREQHDADERRQADDEIPAELRGEVEHEAEDGERRELDDARSAERGVGKEGVSTCRSRWSRDHSKKKRWIIKSA